MDIKLPEEVKEILEKFQKAKFQIYIVGGAVRDLIMGREVNDWDFTTDAKPEEILKLFPEGFYDNKFGTVGVSPLAISYSLLAAKSEIYEITTMRKEGVYKDSRHPVEVSWTNKIEEDLKRRDFTINAIALVFPSVILNEAKRSEESPTNVGLKQAFEAVSPQAESVQRSFANAQDDNYIIIDPFNGQQDIKNKIIRAVGDPAKRFQEDALRLMRAIRIAAQLNFEIEEKTLQAIKENSLLIKEIANERIRDELFKMLESDNARLPSPDGEAPGGQAYEGIIKLKEAGILQIILPEVERCFGIVQEGPKHDRVYDIGEHLFLALKHTPTTDPLVKLAALLHDVGKADTVEIASDGNVTFYQHDVVGGQIVLQITRRFNLSKKQTDRIYRLVRWHLFTVDENQTDSAIRRFIKNVGLENIEDMMAVRIGDRLGGGTQNAVSWRMEEFSKRIKEVLKKPFSISDLKINGSDVMKTLQIKPGPKVGEILQKLFEEVLEDSSKNDSDYLSNRIKELA